ncbi:hypothetical protein AYJ57_13000 [Salipiger sp. CCB-MM3]|nr:hypothetical protein [Salipiger sp. CCB-MM3]ANT61207.1 hypothetical protein AYJ57_13000 [Salipiger sp. CCB-MM3]
MTTIPISPQVFAALMATVAILLVAAYLPKQVRQALSPVEAFQKRLGYERLDSGLFLVLVLLAVGAAVVWLALLLLLVVGLVGLILDTGWSDIPPLNPITDEAKEAVWNWRFKLAQLAALTAVLGAVVTLPITLNRLRLTRAQTETAKEALFNQKITEAAADLHAQRQVTLPETYKKLKGDTARKRFNGWEDDVVRRTAAIDRLEGLVRERPEREIAERVARILSMYVRELSRETWPAETPPKTDDPKELRQWARGLPPLRSDMEAAVVTLSRLAAIVGLPARDLPFDLQESNLQRARLSGQDLQGAHLGGRRCRGRTSARRICRGRTSALRRCKARNLARRTCKARHSFLQRCRERTSAWRR